jgi:predicted Zn-dependent protease
VFITRGLFKQLGSEAELAGVLGHEIAHVTQGHYLAAIKSGGFSKIVAGIVQTKAGNTPLNEAATNLVRNIYAKGLDKSDEYAADRFGMLYAARAGYEPTGLLSVLHLYAAHTGGDGNFQLLFATHPDPKDRIARLEPLLPTFATASDATNMQRFKAVQARL